MKLPSGQKFFLFISLVISIGLAFIFPVSANPSLLNGLGSVNAESGNPIQAITDMVSSVGSNSIPKLIENVRDFVSLEEGDAPYHQHSLEKETAMIANRGSAQLVERIFQNALHTSRSVEDAIDDIRSFFGFNVVDNTIAPGSVNGSSGYALIS